MPRQQQLALPLGQVEVPEHLLRAAYERVSNSVKVGFDDAMQVPHFRICIRRMAMLAAGRGGKRR